MDKDIPFEWIEKNFVTILLIGFPLFAIFSSAIGRLVAFVWGYLFVSLAIYFYHQILKMRQEEDK